MRRNDWLLLGSVMTAACIMLFVYRLITTEGAYAAVVQEGVTTELYPLSENLEVVIETPYGNNTLCIQDGAAFIMQADCPDKLCMKQKKISQNGESLICLPHRLVIQVQKAK